MYRQFEIIYLLLNREKITAKDLAEHFGVSRRTIHRDIDTLSMAGIPVYTDRGNNGGIKIMPEYVLDKSIISDEEQKVILSALQGLKIIEESDADKMLKKLSIMFNKTAEDWLEVDFSHWSRDNGDLFQAVKTAILEKRIIEFDYRSTYGTFAESSQRRVEPVQIWFKSTTWYLKGFCLTRRDMRTFKFVKIRNLTVTNEKFSKRDLTINGSEEEKDEQKKPDVSITLKIAQEMYYRVLEEFGRNQVRDDSDGSFIVTVDWPEDEWVYSRILSYGEYIEVLAPDNIRKTMIEKTQKNLKNYFK